MLSCMSPFTVRSGNIWLVCKSYRPSIKLICLYLLRFSILSPNLILSVFKGASSSWSAHRISAENESQFDASKAVKEGRPVLFTGEV